MVADRGKRVELLMAEPQSAAMASDDSGHTVEGDSDQANPSAHANGRKATKETVR